jgi:hypothetical protein
VGGAREEAPRRVGRAPRRPLRGAPRSLRIGGRLGFNFSRARHSRTETDRWSGWQRPFSIAKVSGWGAARSPDVRGPFELTVRGGAIQRDDRSSHTSLLGKVGGDFGWGSASRRRPT